MSSGLVLSFLRRPSNSSDWNQEELAEFYRVESALLQGGLSVTTDRGISDEGDPWFVFCRADNEEVIAHFARIDREYLIVSNLHSGVARGSDFRRLIRQMIESHPLMLPIRRNQNQKIFLHPAALLAAMLASAYFLSNEKDSTSGNGSLDNAKNPSTNSVAQKFGILAAASLAAIWIEHQADSVFKFLEGTLVFQDNAPSDGKAIHVAETAHDFASLDTAIMQAVRDVESGVHRIDLSNSNLAAPQDGNDHEKVATTLVTQNSTLVNGPDGNNASLANGFNPTTNNDHAGVAHSDPIPNDSDSAVASGNPQPVIPAVAPAILTPSQLTPSPQPSSSMGSIVATSEAVVQLAVSDTTSAAIQPIVLSHGTVPLSLALEQVSAQVGFGPSPPENSAASSTTSTAPTPTPTSSASISEILHTLEVFLQNTPSAEFFSSGSNIIVVDATLSDAASTHFGVLTWDLHNGHTLSIVGIIPQHHAPATA
jgi:hypothetical protein